MRTFGGERERALGLRPRRLPGRQCGHGSGVRMRRRVRAPDAAGAAIPHAGRWILPDAPLPGHLTSLAALPAGKAGNRAGSTGAAKDLANSPGLFNSGREQVI